MISAFFSRQFILFLVTSGVSAIANFSSRILFNHWLDYSQSIILAYAVGIVIAFFLARIFVFTDTAQNIRHSAFVFILVNMIGMFQTWAISMLCVLHVLPSVGVTVWVPEISHFVGLASLAFTSFLGHKYFSFR